MNVLQPIVVTGAEGQLGAELCQQLGQRGVGLTRQRCDLLDPSQVADVLKQLRPAAVINTAAYTAVDRAEQEPGLCRAINADAVRMLANCCWDFDCSLVQISTDYVFGADAARQTPYVENDVPGPINVYGQSKLAGEQVASALQKHLIVRTCGLYGRRVKPGQSNFVDTMLRLARERDQLRIVGDQRCTPSYVQHVARAIIPLVDCGAVGTYHVVNNGETTWHDFAQEIFRLAKLSPKVDRISTAEYGAPAKRPAYSVLDTRKYGALGGPTLIHWKEALAEYLNSNA